MSSSCRLAAEEDMTEREKVAEECAHIAEELSQKYWDMYKGRGKVEDGAGPANYNRGDPHYLGLADGAEDAAIAIRKHFRSTSKRTRV